MKSFLPFCTAMVLAAGAVIYLQGGGGTGFGAAPGSAARDAATNAEVADFWSARGAGAVAPATAVVPAVAKPGAAQGEPIAAALIRVDQAPVSMVCREFEAELRLAAAADPVGDFLEEFFLVSDPSEACRDPRMAARGGYDRDAGRCYTLRQIGTSNANMPMACTESVRQGAGGAEVREVQCSGWNRRLETDTEGGFRLTVSSPRTADVRRASSGSCRPL